MGSTQSLLVAAQGPVQGKVIPDCCIATMQKLEKKIMEGKLLAAISIEVVASPIKFNQCKARPPGWLCLWVSFSHAVRDCTASSTRS